MASSAASTGGEHLVDLGLGDRHRRAEGEGVADGAADDAALHHLLRDPGADLAGLGEAGRRAVRRELEAAHQAEMAGLADQRVAGEPVEVAGEARGEAADAGGHVDRAGRSRSP